MYRRRRGLISRFLTSGMARVDTMEREIFCVATTDHLANLLVDRDVDALEFLERRPERRGLSRSLIRIQITLLSAGACAVAAIVIALGIFKNGRFCGNKRTIGVCEANSETLIGVPDGTNAWRQLEDYFELSLLSQRPAGFIDIPSGLAHQRRSSPKSKQLVFSTSNLVGVLPKVFRLHAAILSEWEAVFELVSIWKKLQESARLSLSLTRGALLSEWVSAAEIEARSIFIFSALRVDSAMMDYALRQRGATTVHWLHGYLDDRYKFYGFSDLCVTKSKCDAAVRQAYGSYKWVVTAPESGRRVPNIVVPRWEGSLLLVTNLLHPAHRLPRKFLEESLLTLFTAIRGVVKGDILWRPHPREVSARRFGYMRSKTEVLGIKVAPPANTISVDLEACSCVISTFSGAVAEILKSGLLPLIWSHAKYDDMPLWSKIPKEICFKSSVELAYSIEWSRNEVNRRKAYEILWDLFDCSLSETPEFGWFGKIYNEIGYDNV